MYLKQLDIVGFKTFADPVRIDFAPGSTALVGPNGCGKSNIVDAIKWVLGESSARAMRSDKMDDVIFGGSSNRKPLSMAEVSLTFADFHDQAGPEEGSRDLTIKRIIYRDGRNEYFINDARATKTEIHKLFLNTGVGKSSYSVMEQGRVDLILSTSPEERRYIFEEAAGISLYKLQLKETRKKLAATENNLLRISDILKEMEREYRQKEKQAGKTEEFFKLEARLKNHGLRILFLKLRQAEKNRDEISAKLKKLYSQREKLQERLSRVADKRGELEKKREELSEFLFSCDKEIELQKAKIEGVRHQGERARRELEELKEQRLELEARARKFSEQKKNLNQSLAKVNQLQLDLFSSIENTRASMKEKVAERDRTREQMETWQKDIEKNQTHINQLNQREEKLRAESAGVIQELLEAIRQRKEELTTGESTRTNLRAAISDGLKKLIEENHPPEEVRVRARELLKDFQDFTGLEDGFRQLFFDKSGIHAHKEELDSKIEATVVERAGLSRTNGDLALKIEMGRRQVEKISEQLAGLEADFREYSARKESVASNQQDIQRQLDSAGEQEKYYTDQVNELNRRIQQNQESSKELAHTARDMEKEQTRLAREMETAARDREKLERQMEEQRESLRREQAELEGLYPEISQWEAKRGALEANLENLDQELFQDFDLTREEAAEELKNSRIDVDKEREAYDHLKRLMAALGQVNPLAVEEYRQIKELYDHNLAQKKDIENAREDLLTIIRDINERSTSQFMETFRQVQENFSRIFSKLFEGGEGSVSLTEPERPLESGIEISVAPPGKNPKTLRMLSGGEKAMTAVAILFSVFKVRSAPFCLMDEIDAPWDESNIGRFLNMLREFLQTSQFIIVTHAKKTMAMTDQILGVTMEEPGVSRLVSISLEELGQKIKTEPVAGG